jgi:hypothetical protein
MQAVLQTCGQVEQQTAAEAPLSTNPKLKKAKHPVSRVRKTSLWTILRICEPSITYLPCEVDVRPVRLRAAPERGCTEDYARHEGLSIRRVTLVLAQYEERGRKSRRRFC